MARTTSLLLLCVMLLLSVITGTNAQVRAHDSRSTQHGHCYVAGLHIAQYDAAECRMAAERSHELLRALPKRTAATNFHGLRTP
jgi:hypothetical protein